MKGFRFAGVVAGIKKKGGLDVGMIAADGLATTAAVFTSNRVKAAPVRLSARHLRETQGRMRGVVVNSGNANACTGPTGDDDAQGMAAEAARALSANPHELLVASTGVIGVPLPRERVSTGIAEAARALSVDGWERFSQAILTTDRRPKSATHTMHAGHTPIRLLGCTKGAGMIAPNMATTLTFVVTDAAIAPAALAKLTRAAVASTFNAIAVDGDTSTNDMLMVMASGAAGPELGPRAQATFGAALTELLRDLATQLIGDGEGVHHVVTLEVRGARNARAAAAVARRVAVSPLVKTAIAGGDPNWGRILCAIGNAGIELHPDRIGLHIGSVEVVRAGAGAPGYQEAEAAAVMQQPTYTMTIDLGAGTAEARFLACDLSHEYVTINADYRS